ncbi:hypothetical protein BsWGS_23991 [Bradybaena similaris]
MAVCIMQAFLPKKAVLIVLLATSFVYSQDHEMLIENCNWATTNYVSTASRTSVILTRPSADLVPNLVCRTRLYVNDLYYTLKMRVRSFDLKGDNYCGPDSEKITLHISDTDASKNIMWCGGMYAKELILPVGAMDLTYNTGTYGEGAGFQLEFSAVPPYSCYDERKLEVTTQPKLLYSPNFPGHYKNSLNCAVQLYAREDQYIQIQSKLVKIESAPSCIFDALIINNVSYCGEDPINVIVPASTVNIKFTSDTYTEMDGYILTYEALPTEILNCSNTFNYSLIAIDTATVVVMNASTSRWPWRSAWCQVVLDSGSDDKVLDMVFLSNLSSVAGYTLSIDGETQYPQNGTLIIDSSVPSNQGSGATTLNFLHSPGRRVVFSVRLRTGTFMFSVKAVYREILPAYVLASNPLVWVNAGVARSPQSSQMIVMPAASGKNVEVRVFYTDKNNTRLDFDADRLPVASYALVYNGDDTNCFELTRGCSIDTSRQGRSVYSIKSQNVTVVIKRDSTSQGFWMYFAPAAENHPPQPEELSISNSFSTIMNQVNVKNLYCEWRFSAASQLDMARYGQVIRLRAKNNFGSGSSVETFIVKEEDNYNSDVMKYTQTTPSDIWMYSRKPIRIIVSVFNNADNLAPRSFLFESEILNSAAGIQPLSCLAKTLQANETVQFAATPNYPDFFQNEPCEFTVVQDSVSGRRNNIVVNFPDLSRFPCSDVYELHIETRNYGDDYFSWPRICGVSSFVQSYQFDQVKITFEAGFQYLVPGFGFRYYISAPRTRDISLQAAEEFQFLSSPNYPSNYPSSVDYQWHIFARSDSSVVDFDLVDFTLEEDIRLQCIHDYVDIYDGSITTAEHRIKTICGSVFYGQYSSTGSELTVVFHSDEEKNYKGFRFRFRSREKDSKEFNISASGHNITGIIIGVIAGGLVLVILIVAAVIYVLRRRKRPRPNMRTRPSAPARPRRGPVPGSDISVFITPGYAPPSYWETHNSPADNYPPSYASVHDDVGHILPDYASGYSCDNPGLNVLELPPPYSSELPVSTLQPELHFGLDASRLDSASSDENTDIRTWPDPNLAADLRDRDDGMNDSVDSNPTEDNTTTGVVTQATNNDFNNSQMTDPPPAYENTLYGQINPGHRHDPRRVPHKKNDRLGFL